MKRLVDTFSIMGRILHTYPIDRLIPTPEDIKAVLSHADAIAAIELMLVPEEHIRKHLRIGSTPPTKVVVFDTPPDHRRLQTLVYEHFGETFICDV